MKIRSFAFRSRMEFGSRMSFWVLILLVIASRIPLLGPGYGSDGDGWRVAASAARLWNEGVYEPSRFPGFPVFEAITTVSYGIGGSLLSNAMSLVAFILALILFRRILLRMQIPSPEILLWTFAFLPILWKNSAVTMDYVWGLTCILFAVECILDSRTILGAVFIGLAAGTRLTHISVILPVYYLLENGNRNKRWLTMAGISLLTTVICYIPVLTSPGLSRFISDYLADMRTYTLTRRLGFFTYRVIYSVGLIGTISALAGLVATKFWKRIPGERKLIFPISMIVVNLVVFWILPDEREYLIPMMPFLLMVWGTLIGKRWLIATACGCLSFAFVNVDFIRHDFGNQSVSLSIGEGFLLRDIHVRKEFDAFRYRLGQAPIPPRSVVMTGVGPSFWVQNPFVDSPRELRERYTTNDVSRSRMIPDVYFFSSLSRTRLVEFTSNGYHAYYLKGVRPYLVSFLDYNPDSAGVSPLDIPVPR